jgi:hypothetical protein
MNNETIENVLHEILNEQKETGKLSKQLINKIEYLSGKVENIEKRTNNHQNITSLTDTKVSEIIREGIENVKQILVAQHKNIQHEKRIIIFPEFKSPECFRLLFNCITYLTIATYSYLIIKVVVDHWCGH